MRQAEDISFSNYRANGFLYNLLFYSLGLIHVIISWNFNIFIFKREKGKKLGLIDKNKIIQKV